MRPEVDDSPTDEEAPAPKRRRAPGLHETSLEIEVPFHDVDPMLVVWHGHYYKYLELARTRLLRARGLDAADLMGLSLGLTMIETRCRYVSPLHYGDRGRVSAWFEDVKYRIHIAYEIENLTRRRRAARASTVLTTTDAEGRMLLRTPEAVLERIAAPPAGAR